MDWTDVEGCADALRGNWLKFESFSWWGRRELARPEDWAIVYTGNRDSGLLDQSNAAYIAGKLSPYTSPEAGDDPDVREESHTHWAVGWVAGWAIRVRNEKGEITPAFREYCDLMDRLADYPILDEEDYSRREYEATLENIADAGRSLVGEHAPVDWPNRAYEWFREHDERAIENRDDRGGYPSPEEMRACLLDLGLLDPDEREDSLLQKEWE